MRMTLLAGLLAGCASGPAFVAAHAPATPMSYRNAAAGAANNVPRQWWTLYHDATLDRLIETTLRDNPYTDVGLQRVAAAQAQVGVAAADELPDLRAGALADDIRTSDNTPLGRILGRRPISGAELGFGANARWQIDLWGRVARAVDAAKARLGAARAYARDVQLVLATEVAVAYWQYRSADADLALLTSVRTQRAEWTRLLAERLGAGLSNEQDFVQARVELGQADIAIDDARRKRSLAEQELATLAVKPLREFSVANYSSYRLPAIPAITPGLPAVILDQRPDLVEAAQSIRELLAQEQIAETAFYPTISLTGDFGFASSQLGNLVHFSSREFSAGPLSLSLPIFDGGRNRATLATARAQYGEAVDQYRSKLLIALREVDDALVEIKLYRDRMRVQRETLAQARRLVALARSRYRRGESDYAAVTVAERGALEVERQLNQSWTEALLATVRLVGALGTGWDTDGKPVMRGGMQ